MQHLSLTPASFTLARASVLGALVCAALLLGCQNAAEPVAQPTKPTTATPPPTPPPTPSAPSTTGSIAGFVIDKSEQCIIGARVEMIDGPRAGDVFVQTVCGFWDYGDDLGYSFHDLPLGIPVTVRATAQGYRPADRRVAPTNPYSYTTMIVLTKEQ